MNRKPTTSHHRQRPRPFSSPNQKPPPRKPPAPPKPTFDIVERVIETAKQVEEEKPFRILIAVHRPRFRGRAERAVARAEWEITSLLNKQDPVGQCAKAQGRPDILLLSGDFGRQRNYAIFRAVQKFRAEGMILVGLVDDCEEAPDEFPDSSPNQLCDLCITPPVKTAELCELFAGLYRALRNEEPPPMLRAVPHEEEEGD